MRATYMQLLTAALAAAKRADYDRDVTAAALVDRFEMSASLQTHDYVLDVCRDAEEYLTDAQEVA